MDPLITGPMLVSALTKLLDSAAGEAGKRSWSVLAGILSKNRAKRLSRGEALDSETVAAPPTSPDGIAAFADRVALLAAADPELASELRSWHSTVSAINVGNTSNNVTGTVHGDVVQARDISGPISFS